ncbi:hypothetical protein PHMEG_00031045 [Phytophthora megakarya]|uniref:Uncharacterized protein n=1 Tax=Phytophthora megakarya TaxID=4795 RepID=A0A225UXJ2_9STRA|nr:hypothetical protein PHMEG_00031045 [Phytophthora megakarya]
MLSLRLGNRLLSPFESNTACQLDVPHDLLADMIVYADDADFAYQSAEIATLIETEAPAVLAKWSLQMNTSKTEHTIVHRQVERQTPTNATDRPRCRPSDTFCWTPASTCPRPVPPPSMRTGSCYLEGFNRDAYSVRAA